MLILLLTILPKRTYRVLYWGFGILLLPLITGFGPPRQVDRIYVPTQRVTGGEVQQVATVRQLPTVSAEAFLLYDVDANQLILTQNIHATLPPASLTKLMTALLVLEESDLTASVTIQGSDLVGGTSIGLRAGETITVEQLLWGSLIPSGNDAATALARYAAGSVSDFVEQMNKRAQELGLSATHFINPHGLDAAGHTSSAADLLTLTQQLWRYPLFRQIVATTESEVAGRKVRNTNELLAIDGSVNGVKTGTTDLAGQCLVTGIQRNGHQIFIIVLNSRDRYADTQALYGHYVANYTWFEGQRVELSTLNRIYTGTGTTWYLRPVDKPAAWLVHVRDVARLRSFRRLHLPRTEQPWEPGMPVGVLEWWLDDQIIGTQPLMLW